jgi:hypothetical protein
MSTTGLYVDTLTLYWGGKPWVSKTWLSVVWKCTGEEERVMRYHEVCCSVRAQFFSFDKPRVASE